jgi:small subunit ribosomal protein S18
MARAFFRRRKSCPFSGKDAPRIDYKERELARAIKRARHIGLLPYIVK